MGPNQKRFDFNAAFNLFPSQFRFGSWAGTGTAYVVDLIDGGGNYSGVIENLTTKLKSGISQEEFETLQKIATSAANFLPDIVEKEVNASTASNPSYRAAAESFFKGERQHLHGLVQASVLTILNNLRACQVDFVKQFQHEFESVADTLIFKHFADQDYDEDQSWKVFWTDLYLEDDRVSMGIEGTSAILDKAFEAYDTCKDSLIEIIDKTFVPRLGNRREWRKVDPENPEEVRAFFKECYEQFKELYEFSQDPEQSKVLLLGAFLQSSDFKASQLLRNDSKEDLQNGIHSVTRKLFHVVLPQGFHSVPVSKAIQETAQLMIDPVALSTKSAVELYAPFRKGKKGPLRDVKKAQGKGAVELVNNVRERLIPGIVEQLSDLEMDLKNKDLNQQNEDLKQFVQAGLQLLTDPRCEKLFPVIHELKAEGGNLFEEIAYRILVAVSEDEKNGIATLIARIAAQLPLWSEIDFSDSEALIQKVLEEFGLAHFAESEAFLEGFVKQFDRKVKPILEEIQTSKAQLQLKSDEVKEEIKSFDDGAQIELLVDRLLDLSLIQIRANFKPDEFSKLMGDWLPDGAKEFLRSGLDDDELWNFLMEQGAREHVKNVILAQILDWYNMYVKQVEGNPTLTTALLSGLIQPILVRIHRLDSFPTGEQEQRVLFEDIATDVFDALFLDEEAFPEQMHLLIKKNFIQKISEQLQEHLAIPLAQPRLNILPALLKLKDSEGSPHLNDSLDDLLDKAFERVSELARYEVFEPLLESLREPGLDSNDELQNWIENQILSLVKGDNQDEMPLYRDLKSHVRGIARFGLSAPQLLEEGNQFATKAALSLMERTHQVLNENPEIKNRTIFFQDTADRLFRLVFPGGDEDLQIEEGMREATWNDLVETTAAFLEKISSPIFTGKFRGQQLYAALATSKNTFFDAESKRKLQTFLVSDDVLDGDKNAKIDSLKDSLLQLATNFDDNKSSLIRLFEKIDGQICVETGEDVLAVVNTHNFSDSDEEKLLDVTLLAALNLKSKEEVETQLREQLPQITTHMIPLEMAKAWTNFQKQLDGIFAKAGLAGKGLKKVLDLLCRIVFFYILGTLLYPIIALGKRKFYQNKDRLIENLLNKLYDDRFVDQLIQGLTTEALDLLKEEYKGKDMSEEELDRWAQTVHRDLVSSLISTAAERTLFKHMPGFVTSKISVETQEGIQAELNSYEKKSVWGNLISVSS